MRRITRAGAQLAVAVVLHELVGIPAAVGVLVCGQPGETAGHRVTLGSGFFLGDLDVLQDRLLGLLRGLDLLKLDLGGDQAGGAAGGLQLPPGVVPGLVPPDQLPDGPSAMAPEASDMAAAPAEAPESDMAAAP